MSRGVAGDGGRGGVDLLDQQGQGAGHPQGGGWLQLDGDLPARVGDGPGEPADDGLAGDGPVLVVCGPAASAAR